MGERTPPFEITPEMMAAGARQLGTDTAADLVEGYAMPEEVARRVFEAMLEASRTIRTFSRT